MANRKRRGSPFSGKHRTKAVRGEVLLDDRTKRRLSRIRWRRIGTVLASAGIVAGLVALYFSPALRVHEIEVGGAATVSAADIEAAAGVIKKGTIALKHSRHIGKTREGTEIIQQQIWYMDDPEQTRLESKMEVPGASGWRINIDGDINLVVDIDFSKQLSQEEHVAQGMSTTGFHLVNAVPPVCEAGDPGIKTFLDLPMITGCMGTLEANR